MIVVFIIVVVGAAAVRETWGAFGMQKPHHGGFRRAVALGFSNGSSDDEDEGDTKEHFAFKVVTINVTAWRSAIAFLLSTDADVLLVQEHKLGPEEVDEAVAWLRRRGWNAIMAPAGRGPNGGWSAGVAILARPHVGLGLPLVGSEVIQPARAIAARVEPPGCRPCTVVCVYLHDGMGPAQCNMDLLRRTEVCLAAQGEDCPYIMGGDFQMTPQEIAAAGFAQESHAVLVAAGAPSGTCRTHQSAREIDYFYVSAGLATGIDSVEVIPRTGIKTHLPVALQFQPCLTSLKALVVRKPPPLSTERIVGPLRKVAKWDDIAAQAERLAVDGLDDDHDIDVLHRRLGEVFQKWADQAELELVECAVDGQTMPKLGLRGRAPVMVWRSILPERAPEGPEGDVVRWRNVANAGLACNGRR